MKESFKTGIGFGVTSGIITTLGLMVGLNSGTHSQAVVMGGILTIAIADSLSDAMGIHISEESKKKSLQSIWESTISTFLVKFFFALTFLIPILIFPLADAIIINVAWGLLALAFFTYYISNQQKKSPWYPIAEHVLIAVLVISLTNYIGGWISVSFGL
ncbi:hypothetical protein JXB01_00490 [Candidatus Micrarchaeota archaeon]|nr:hypothetical protein [Candidatus Micrarchaeota archaeon]